MISPESRRTLFKSADLHLMVITVTNPQRSMSNPERFSVGISFPYSITASMTPSIFWSDSLSDSSVCIRLPAIQHFKLTIDEGALDYLRHIGGGDA